MHFTTPLILMASIATLCSALDLNLWTNAGCGGSSVSCIDAGYQTCCTGGSPFCASGKCDGCVVGNDIYTFNRASCSGSSFASCRAAVGNGCCRSAGGGNTCAIIAYRGNARAAQAVTDPEECKASVRPNKMVYTNRNGTEREIHIPTGTFDTAALHVVEEDWDALDQFPAWANQKYTENDYIRKVKRTD